MFRKTLKIIQLVLQFIIKLIAFIFKTSKLIILFIFIIFIFYASKVDAQVVPSFHIAYFQHGLSFDCSEFSTDIDTGLILFLKSRNIKVSDRFYLTPEYIDKETLYYYNSSPSTNNMCVKEILGSNVST